MGVLGPTPAVDEEEPVRVLLVEDSPTDRELVGRAFRHAESPARRVALEAVGDVAAALEQLRNASFGIVLTDYSLPGRTGLDLVRAMRDADDPTPIVVMTGSGDEALAVAALQQGAADYVVKELGYERALPLVVERVLQARIRDLAEERERRDAAQYTKRLERQVQDQTAALRRALTESEALRRIGQALAAARQLKPALDLVAQTAAELTRANAAGVLITHGREHVLVSVSGAVKQVPGLKGTELAATLSAGWAATATAPMRNSDAEIGLLWIASATAPGFTSRHGELLEAIAELTALSIANVRAHEELRRLRAGTDPRLDEAAPAPADVSHDGNGPSGMSRAPAPVETVHPSKLVVPPFPAALGRLLAIADSDDASPDTVEETVRLDPLLAARTVQLASSPVLGRAHAASSLREAVTVLGVRGVRNLAFAQFSRRLLTRSGVIDELLWEQATWTAVACQLVLEARQPAVADDAYLCGLLHNVGAIALNNAYPDRYERAWQTVLAGERSPSDAEREQLGCDAADATDRLIAAWSLPTRVVETIRDLSLGRASASSLVSALRWARTAAFRANPVWRSLLGSRGEPAWVGRELAAAEPGLALSPEALGEVVCQSSRRCDVLRGLVA